MRSSTRLDSAVFQLTPTRTRCDLVINANGKTEKIASGLVNPFIAHLKTAKDQMAKGGYSIVLEPQPGCDASWFTRGIIERFVRFVSTPEILERVYTLETEILQMEEAITIQKNSNSELTTVDRHQAKSVESSEGSRLLADFDNEKALVFYEPGAQPPKSNGSTTDGNTKVQLMKVLETRKTALQKEQGMAFARAVAAGFDIDHMVVLMSFAESFGASRLMDACMRFKELWKRKHESGQWVDIEAAEAISCRSDFSAMNASGIVLSTSDNNGQPCVDQTSAEQKPLVDQQSSSGHQFQGQFPHPMCPPWPMLASPGSLPTFQGYPVQGVPYYPNYPGTSPYFQPMYPSGEESTPNAGQRLGRRHSMDSGTEPEAGEADVLRTRSLDNRESRRKNGRACRNQSGMVVIRNLNYISERKNSSGSESESASDSEADEESGEPSTHRGSSSKRKGNKGKSTDKMTSTVTEGTVDGGQWQAFQNFLLKDADEREYAVDRDMLEMEKNVQARRRQNASGYDPMVDGREQDIGGGQQGYTADMQKISGKLAHVMKLPNDELLSSKGGQFPDGEGLDIRYAEINGRRGGYRRTTNDDFMVVRREQQLGSSLSDSMVVNGLEHAKDDIDRTNNMDDESYILQLRSSSQSQFRNERNANDMDSEFTSNVKVLEKVEYEPDYSSLMPNRDTGIKPLGYDPAIYYSLQNETLPSLSKKNKDGAVNSEEGSKKLPQNRRSKLTPDNLKKVGPIRKGKPLDEARARAERLRSYKADLQKMKKEKEEEDIKRLEALKLERQKRIAARSGNTPALSASQQSKKQLPTKASPHTQKGSKFSDSVPGPVSPLQRFPTRTVSTGSAESLKGSKPGKLTTGSHSNGNPLRRSASSLPELRKEKNDATPDAKATTSRLRRLSEPKISSSPLVSSVKPRNSELVSKRKVASAPESKKITAIVNHDKTKSATLPELKIRPTKGSGLSKESMAHKEVSKSVNVVKSVSSSKGIDFGRDTDKTSHVIDDDGPVIEKTVVMLEYEKPSVPAVNPSSLGENLEQIKEHSSNNKVNEILEPAVDHGALGKPISHPTERQPIACHILDKPRDSEATETTRNADTTLAKSLSDSLGGEPYQAPNARVSSLENPCTRNSRYGIAPPSSLHMDLTGTETHKAHVVDPTSFKLERIPEASKNPQVKESSKGFRRLLKFGRKGNTTSDNASEADNVSLNGSDADHNGANATSSSEANTLKNLISQDETPIAGSTPQKSSKQFSLLSPFRSKSSEKKQTA